VKVKGKMKGIFYKILFNYGKEYCYEGKKNDRNEEILTYSPHHIIPFINAIIGDGICSFLLSLEKNKFLNSIIFSRIFGIKERMKEINYFLERHC